MTTMTQLMRTFGGKVTATLLKLTASGVESELPTRQFYELQWLYYLSNGLYDQLRSMGHLVKDQRLKALRNPAFRVVEFYPAVIWAGKMPIETDNPRIEPAIRQLWRWSNWTQQKQVLVRQAAITGIAFVKVAQPSMGIDEDGMPAPSSRVFMQLIDARHMSEYDTDERGYITYAKIDLPQSTREMDKLKHYTHTEIWDRERVRIYRHENGVNASIGQMGEPVMDLPLSTWGIDFVPIVAFPHMVIDENAGMGAFTAQIEKIDEVCRQASRLHSLMFRHDNVTWALKANSVSTDGRPLPPPRISGFGAGESETIELGDEKLLKLPGNSDITSLVPNLHYVDHLAAIDAAMAELRDDLPEIQYWSLRDLPEMSGKALRLLLTGAVNRAKEVRGNHEQALARAHMMALTIGQKVGAWKNAGIPDVGRYENGDFEHGFMERDIIPLSRDETAELVGKEVSAGIPLRTALRRAGWSAGQIEEMMLDKQAEQEEQQANIATALLNAQRNLANGQASNGLEQPE